MKTLLNVGLKMLSRKINRQIESVKEVEKNDQNLDSRLKSVAESRQALEIELEEFCKRNPESVLCKGGHNMKWK